MTLTMEIRHRLPHFELDVSLTCRAGELTAIVGPSGAGKSTLIRLVAGLERPDHGYILLGDTVYADRSTGVFLPPQKRGLGLVFQDYTLFPHLTVAGNVGFAAKDKSRVPELLEMFGIAHLAGERPANVSGGERQRAAFCQALATEPALLLLDEPFSALDAATRRTLRAELAELKKHLSIPVLHVTHDLEEACELGDAILPLAEGRIAPKWLDENYYGSPMRDRVVRDMPTLCIQG